MCERLRLGVMVVAVLRIVSAVSAEDLPGRPVRVVSIGIHDGTPLNEACALVDKEGAQGADLILLPETWTGHKMPLDTVAGPTLPRMRELAQRHHTAIVCPLDRMDGSTRYNTAFVIGPDGALLGAYNKVYPYWSEFKGDPVTPGDDAPVFDLPFGKLGVAICFDANFPEVWQRLADRGAEIVAWPSAYSAGTQLQAHALNHHFYIVSCTLVPDCIVYDITGKELLHENTAPVNVSRITLDLDRVIFHQNYNTDRRDKLLRDHPDDVEQDCWMPLEQWFVLKAKRPGVSVHALAEKYGMTPLRDYKTASRRGIDARRGASFSEKVWTEYQTMPAPPLPPPLR